MSLQGSDSQLSKGNTETQWSEVSNNERSKTCVLCRFLIRRHLLLHVLFPTMGRQIMAVIKHLPLGITDLSITNISSKFLQNIPLGIKEYLSIQALVFDPIKLIQNYPVRGLTTTKLTNHSRSLKEQKLISLGRQEQSYKKSQKTTHGRYIKTHGLSISK